MTIGWYNGWSPEQRRATLPLQRAAIRAGLIPKPTRCSICGFADADDPSGKNVVGWHTEDYDNVLDAYPICRRDHATLHRRFERPRPWLRLVAEHGDGTCWFEKLSMDPATQQRPYGDTYPAGVASTHRD